MAVIQQRHLPVSKKTYWDAIDVWMVDELYLHPLFPEVFAKYASPPNDGLYPTLTIRQLMWALRMKPLPREFWETSFDRKPL